MSFRIHWTKEGQVLCGAKPTRRRGQRGGYFYRSDVALMDTPRGMEVKKHPRLCPDCEQIRKGRLLVKAPTFP